MSKRILVLEDDDSLRLVISKALSRAGFEVRATASPQTAIDKMAAGAADALVADVLLGRENFLERLDELARLRPDAPVVVISAQTTAATAIRAAQGGAFEYLPKPFDLDDLVAILSRALKRPSAPLRADDGYAGLIGRSQAMQEAFRVLGRLAGRREPVLVVGPDGSGRAAAARVLHTEGKTGGPLVEAGPERLAEAPGLFERADGGTLLLRRAEDWDARSQGRVREYLEAEQGGARIVATAAADVRSRLPSALLDRLAIGFVECPPVRARGSDRSLLLKHFLDRASNRTLQLSSDAVAFADTQAWPGEVAEIRRVAERLAAQGARGEIGADDVAAALAAPRAPAPAAALRDAAERLFAELHAAGDPHIAASAADALDAGLIVAALEAAGGVRQEAARLLGMNRNTFARRADALGIGASDAL